MLFVKKLMWNDIPLLKLWNSKIVIFRINSVLHVLNLQYSTSCHTYTLWLYKSAMCIYHIHILCRISYFLTTQNLGVANFQSMNEQNHYCGWQSGICILTKLNLDANLHTNISSDECVVQIFLLCSFELNNICSLKHTVNFLGLLVGFQFTRVVSTLISLRRISRLRNYI